MPADPHKSARDINAVQVAKTRSSASIIGPRKVIQAEIIASREWTEVVSTSGVISYINRIGTGVLVEREAMSKIVKGAA